VKVFCISMVVCVQDDVDAVAAYQEIGNRIGAGGRNVIGEAHLEVAMHAARDVPTPEGQGAFVDRAEAYLRTQAPFILHHANRPPEEVTDYDGSGQRIPSEAAP
jgi:hypothetical protein